MKNPVRSQMSGRYRDCERSMHCRFRARRTLHRKARAHNLDRHPFRARRRAAKSGRSPAAPSRPSPHSQGRPRVILRPARKIHLHGPFVWQGDIYLYRVPLARERNLLAHPTLDHDVYLPLSKFESIHNDWVSHGLTTRTLRCKPICYKTLS